MSAVIFDMDGVLIDSETIYMQQFYELFIDNGYYITKKDVYSIIGTDNETTWDLLSKAAQPSISSEQIKELYNEQVDNDDLNFYDIKFPHVQTILKILKKNDIKTAIASSSSLQSIENMIEQCNIVNYIDYYISGESLKESKPNPEIYTKAMKKLKTNKENTIIIEDSHSGIKAGKSSEAFVIAIRDRKFGIDQTNADLIVDNLIEAFNFIKEFFEL